MSDEAAIGFPGDRRDQRELLLAWLGYLRHAVIRKASGVGEAVERNEEELAPGPELTARAALDAYAAPAVRTDALVRDASLDAPCSIQPDTTLRWVLLHLINETARHAGHADAVRELLDGTTGK